MQPTSREETDAFGNKKTVHYDEHGNKTGESREREGLLGTYTEHYDKLGNKTGESRDREGLLGAYTEHTDKQGGKTGESREREGLLGAYTEHTDKHGVKIGESREREGLLGPYTEHSGTAFGSAPKSAPQPQTYSADSGGVISDAVAGAINSWGSWDGNVKPRWYVQLLFWLSLLAFVGACLLSMINGSDISKTASELVLVYGAMAFFNATAMTIDVSHTGRPKTFSCASFPWAAAFQLIILFYQAITVPPFGDTFKRFALYGAIAIFGAFIVGFILGKVLRHIRQKAVVSAVALGAAVIVFIVAYIAA